MAVSERAQGRTIGFMSQTSIQLRVREATTVRLIPYALLAASFLLSAGADDDFVPPGRLPAIAGLSVVVVALRVTRERIYDRSRPVQLTWFLAHAVVMAALVLLSPLYGFYVFSGYLDAFALLTGRGLYVAACGFGSLSALAQVGGVAGARSSPAVWLVLAVINGALTSAMVSFAQAREVEVSRREQVVAELEQVHRENAALQARVLEQARDAGRLDERARLSREIHDTVAQGLVGVITQLEAIDRADDEAAWRGRVSRATGTARESLSEARRAVAALASPALDDADLVTALERLARSWSDTYRIDGRVQVDGHSRSSENDATLLRVAQEALSNVGRHSGAHRATLTLTYLADSVRLDVRDDGSGFDPHRADNGHGLLGMRARIEQVGGSLAVESRDGAGATISAAVPA